MFRSILNPAAVVAALALPQIAAAAPPAQNVYVDQVTPGRSQFVGSLASSPVTVVHGTDTNVPVQTATDGRYNNIQVPADVPLPSHNLASGTGNTSIAYQNGNGNSATINQFGTNNVALSSATGDANVLTQNQIGSTNYSLLSAQSASGNILLTNQLGNQNQSTVQVNGTGGNIINNNQIGNGLSYSVNHTGAPIAMSITQVRR
jgi:hypothetical protein